MTDEQPEVIERDGGWMYAIGGMEFGSYPSREAALIAAQKHLGESPGHASGSGEADDKTLRDREAGTAGVREQMDPAPITRRGDA